MKKLLCLFTFLLPTLLFAQLNFIENTVIRFDKSVINTSFSEFGPAYVGNELWYSGFTDEKITRLNEGRTKNIYYNLFASPVDESGLLKQGKNVMLENISAGYHAGPVSYCENTGELFITLSNFENAEVKNTVFQKKNIPLKILILKKNGSSWEKKAELPFNNSSYSVGHPAVSVTGDTLVFASDAPGKGKGGTDLYMTIKKDGQWGALTNLGSQINTSANDMFPYLHKGRILFYASDGKAGGKGGFDIWYAVINENGFSEPVNLSELNSSSDDFGLIVHSNEETGYFVSNRLSENNSDDIYKVEFTGNYDLELLVKNRKTGEPVPGAEVQFSDNQSLTSDDQGIIRRTLEKHKNYKATTNLEGYMNESVNFTTEKQNYGTIKKELHVEKVEVGQKFVMNNIYYEYDKWNLLSESESELDKLIKVLNDNPSWKVELGSHTDCRGTNDYNDNLSAKRSDSAVKYITGKGIADSRILSRGYGEIQLLNHCSDGVTCTEDEHRINRRTEFKILELN